MNTIRRLFWWFQIRSLEITVDGQSTAIDLLSHDPMMQTRVMLARSETRRELAKARANYLNTYPAGHRRVWDFA